jgi:hypothetical protein
MSATAAVAAPSPAETVVGDEAHVETVEGEPAADPPAEGAPVEGEGAPAEGEPAAAEEPTVEIPEETLKAAALKYADAEVKRANQTMAAARRAEARVEVVRAENATLKGNLQTYQGFVSRLQAGDPSALAEAGFKTVRDFLDTMAAFGEPAKAKSPEELAREEIDKRFKAREEAEAKAKAEAALDEQKQLLFKSIDADKARFARVSTARGKEELWDAVGSYYEKHKAWFDKGNVFTDAMVFGIADAVEKDLRAEFGDPQVSASRPAAKNGATPAATTGRNSGKTLTNKASSGAPGERSLSMDEEERRRQVNELMRANGEL